MPYSILKASERILNTFGGRDVLLYAERVTFYNPPYPAQGKMRQRCALHSLVRSDEVSDSGRPVRQARSQKSPQNPLNCLRSRRGAHCVFFRSSAGAF